MRLPGTRYVAPGCPLLCLFPRGRENRELCDLLWQPASSRAWILTVGQMQLQSHGISHPVMNCCLVPARMRGSYVRMPAAQPSALLSVLAFAHVTDTWQRTETEGTWQMLFLSFQWVAVLRILLGYLKINFIVYGNTVKSFCTWQAWFCYRHGKACYLQTIFFNTSNILNLNFSCMLLWQEVGWLWTVPIFFPLLNGLDFDVNKKLG